MKQEQIIAQKWSALQFPIRPTQEQLSLYNKTIAQVCSLRKNKKTRIVLFGALPELWEMLAQYNCKVTTISVAEVTLGAMKYLTKDSTLPVSKSIVAPWEKTGLLKNSFDLAISDIALISSSFDRYQAILKEMQKILKPEGFLITRIFDLQENYKKPDIKEILEKWRKNEISLSDFVYLASNLAIDSDNYIDFMKMLKSLESMHTKKELTSEELEQVKPYFGNAKLYRPYRTDMINLFSEYFQDISLHVAQDLEGAKENPLYFMKVKK